LGASHPELGHAMLVCATETKLDRDIEAYANALRDAIESPRAARGAA
jgi:glycine dehydrogenase subunit 1